MGLFGGADPRDEMVAMLREERDHLRARVSELEKTLLAMTDRNAYRVLHPEPRTTTAGPVTVDAWTQRHTTLKPEFTLDDVERQIKGDA